MCVCADSNGGWMKSNPIPPEYPNWNTFLALHTQNQERLKVMLAELQAKAEEGAAPAGPADVRSPAQAISARACCLR